MKQYFTLLLLILTLSLISCEEEPHCGDKKVNTASETCDDGNNLAGDGCYRCTVETGWDCMYSECVPVCGDGYYVWGVEECDPSSYEWGSYCNADYRVLW